MSLSPRAKREAVSLPSWSKAQSDEPVILSEAEGSAFARTLYNAQGRRTPQMRCESDVEHRTECLEDDLRTKLHNAGIQRRRDRSARLRGAAVGNATRR